MALRGSAATFKLGSNTVAELSSCTINLNGDTIDVTTFDSSSLREFIAGLRGGTVDISGFYTGSDTNGQEAMLTAFLAGTTLETTQQPEFLVDGTNGFQADGVISSISIGAEVAGAVSFSASIQLTGTITVV